MNPKISVITICFNSAKTIENTIKSVLNQNYDNLEYIIVDGGSTDGTIDIIKKYDSQISFWISEPDKGISDAFNKGIAVATGEIIGIVNSDDQYLPGALSAVARNYEKNIDVYRGSILIHDDIKNEEYTYQPSMKFGVIPINVNVCHLPTFIAKRAYEKYGSYDINFKIAMDLDLLRRFYRKGAVFKKIDKVLGKFNVGGVSTQNGFEEGVKERKQIILKNGGCIIHILIYDIVLGIISAFKFCVSQVLNLDYKKVRY